MVLIYKGVGIIYHHDTTWWITGFNPNYLNINIRDLTAQFTINFSSKEIWYYYFYNKYKNSPFCTFNHKRSSVVIKL